MSITVEPPAVWIVFAAYRDMSSVKILGVYDQFRDATDRVDIANAADPMCVVNLARFPLNKCCVTELHP